ncbi:MAG: hypothetical protein Q9209_000058 [Squamulea sp. 1 TL-2023]
MYGMLKEDFKDLPVNPATKPPLSVSILSQTRADMSAVSSTKRPKGKARGKKGKEGSNASDVDTKAVHLEDAGGDKKGKRRREFGSDEDDDEGESGATKKIKKDDGNADIGESEITLGTA